MTFAKKVITTTITLGGGLIGNQVGQSVSLTGYRTVVNMSAYFGNTMGTLQCKIYGLPMDMMTQLTTIGPIAYQIRGQNSISLAVGDDGKALTTVFTGTIQNAWADFQEAPNVSLNIISYSPYWASVLPVKASSFKGATSLNTILTQLVAQINTAAPDQNLVLEQPVPSVMLTDQYLPGAALNQIKLAIEAARCSYRIDQNVLTVWQTGQYTPDPVIKLSPTSDPGIVGYPTFSSDGVIIKCGFAPLRQGQEVVIEGSILPQANTSWIAQNIVHNLESERPGGAWFTQFIGTRRFF